jgi:DNA-directed RNA polymerase subunit RPC12/RpoP
MSKQRKHGQDLTSLRTALRSSDCSIARDAAVALGRLGPRAKEAVDDLIATAIAPWQDGCPQLFSEAIEALVKIAASDPRLVGVIRPTIRCSNYGVLKSAVLALEEIGTEEAIDTLRRFDAYWGSGRKDRLIDELVHKVLDRYMQRGDLPEGSKTAPEFVEHRGALFRRSASCRYRSSAYCPRCRGPMTSLMGTVPYRCRRCGVKVDFNGQQLQSVLKQLP